MQPGNLGQPDGSAPPPPGNDATPPSPAPSTPADVRFGGLRALTAILIAERQKKSQADEDAALSNNSNKG